MLPGSIALAAPFVALGDSGLQNIFWLGAFLVVARYFFKDAALALYLLAVSLALSPAALYEFISGGDIIANGTFIPAFFLISLTLWNSPSASMGQRLFTSALVGVGLASRANFILLLPLLGAVVWKTAGLRNALLCCLTAGLTFLATVVPFYLHDPSGFTPLGSRNKISALDLSVPGASATIIVATAIASLTASLLLLRRSHADVAASFFKSCALVTLAPLLGAILFSSWIHREPNFDILRDRFGLMFVFFAILGWGKRFRSDPSGEPVSGMFSSLFTPPATWDDSTRKAPEP